MKKAKENTNGKEINMNSGRNIDFIIDASDSGRTVGSVLKERLGISRCLSSRIRREGEVYINGNPGLFISRLKEGDILSVKMEFIESSNIEPEYISLDILYEDEDLLVVNKPPGMLVHPVAGEELGTLANGVMRHWLDSKKEHTVFRAVYRIDRDTSGMVLISGNHLAHLGLQRQLEDKTMERIYIALVEGMVREDRGTICLPIRRKPGSTMVREVAEDGRESVTNFKVLQRFPQVNASLLELSLGTGRTHQIRVHMSHMGHPLLGDTLYGGTIGPMSRQALHSHRLNFCHPITGKPCQFTCPLPQDMKAILEK